MIDTPTPTLNGHGSQIVAVLPTVVKNNNMDTDVICTNLGGSTIDLGFEVFSATGVRANNVAAGNGALVGVAKGRTVTFGTGGTVALHEDAVVTLEPPTGVTSLANGAGRIVANSGATVGCVAYTIDSLHNILDPALSAMRTPSMSTLTVNPPPGGPATTTTTTTPGPTTTTTTLPAPACGASPLAGCRPPFTSLKAKLTIKNFPDNAKDQLAWKWLAGTATTKLDLGTPTTTTGYAVCVYAGGALVQGTQVPAAGTCGIKSCWSENAKGFKWTNKTAPVLQQVDLKSGGDGLAKIAVKGKGAGLNPPGIPLALPVRVQIKNNNGGGTCWEATYSFPIKNDPVTGQFNSKAD